MADDDRLSLKQRQAVAALIAFPTARAAAQAVGISERTLNRWRNAEAFQNAHRQAAEAVWDAALTQLRASQLQAVEALRDALAAPVVSDRIRAARALLDFALRATDADLEHRLTTLEEAWPADDQPPGSRALRLAAR